MAGTAMGGRSRRLWRLAAAGAVGLVVAYLCLVRTRAGQRLDGTPLEHRFAVTDAAAERAQRLLDAISERSVVLCSAALVCVALACRRVALAVGVVVALGGSMAGSQVLKDHVLTRTDLGGFGGVAYNTFPSGHATVAMALALGLVMVAPARFGAAAVALAAVVGPTVGTAVLATGGHRPSDSVGAFLATVTWYAACAAVVTWFERRQRTATDAGPSAPRWSLAVASLGAFVVLVVVLAWSVSGPARRITVGAWPYVLGCLAIDVVGIGVVGAFAGIRLGVRRHPP
jgi:PAP2 superfamily